MGKCHSTKNSSSQENTITSSFQIEQEQNIVDTLNKLPINTEMLISKINGNPLEKYEVIKKMGKSNIRKIYQVKLKELNLFRAMKKKKIIKEPNLDKKDDEEVEILKKLDHPNIIKVFEYYIRKDHLYIITEYLPNGSLKSQLSKNEKLEESHVCMIFQQILSAVCYFHQKGIIHFYLRPDRILLGDPDINGHYSVKLIEFGMTDDDQKGKENLQAICNYSAPELSNSKAEINNEKIDIWCCGIILFQMLFGKLPFSGNEAEINEKKKGMRIEFENKNTVPPDVKDIIYRLLDRDPNRRFTASEAIKHNWISCHTLKYENPKNNETLITNLFKRWKIYKPANIIQKTSLAYMIHNIPNKEITEIERLFRLIDEDEDGKISRENLISKMKLIEKERYKDNFIEFSKEIDRLFDIADYDSSGYIENQEFIRACIDKTIFLSEENLKFAYDYFDPNSLGFIGLKELSDRFTSADERALKKFLEEISSKYNDPNDTSGRISPIVFNEILKEI